MRIGGWFLAALFGATGSAYAASPPTPDVDIPIVSGGGEALTYQWHHKGPPDKISGSPPHSNLQRIAISGTNTLMVVCLKADRVTNITLFNMGETDKNDNYRLSSDICPQQYNCMSFWAAGLFVDNLDPTVQYDAWVSILKTLTAVHH